MQNSHMYSATLFIADYAKPEWLRPPAIRTPTAHEYQYTLAHCGELQAAIINPQMNMR
jgi:hypothetical protein